jgi:Mor family transcriptional regulator
MGRMNDMLIDICESWERGTHVQDIADWYDMSVTQVLQILQDFGHDYHPPIVGESRLYGSED